MSEHTDNHDHEGESEACALCEQMGWKINFRDTPVGRRCLVRNATGLVFCGTAEEFEAFVFPRG